MAGTIFMIIIILLIVYIVTSCVRIVPQAQAYVIERLGAYNGTWSVGMHFKVPFIDRVAKKDNPSYKAGSVHLLFLSVLTRFLRNQRREAGLYRVPFPWSKKQKSPAF